MSIHVLCANTRAFTYLECHIQLIAIDHVNLDVIPKNIMSVTKNFIRQTPMLPSLNITLVTKPAAHEKRRMSYTIEK